MWFFIKIVTVKSAVKLCNIIVSESLKVERGLVAKIFKLKVKFLGHLKRGEGIDWDILCGTVQRRRRKGRPRINLIKSITLDLECNYFKIMCGLPRDRNA